MADSTVGAVTEAHCIRAMELDTVLFHSRTCSILKMKGQSYMATVNEGKGSIK